MAVVQAVAAQEAAEAEHDAAGTDADRRARLRDDRATRLAYDAEQQQLRAAVVQQLHASNASSGDESGDGKSDGDGAAAGLNLKRRAAALTEVRPPAPLLHWGCTTPATIAIALLFGWDMMCPADLGCICAAIAWGPSACVLQGMPHAKSRRCAAQDSGANAAAALQQDLHAYFGGQSRTADDAFLERFLAQRLWAVEGDDAGDSRGRAPSGPGLHAPAASDEEAFSDRADDFERDYNFRCGYSALLPWGQVCLRQACTALLMQFGRCLVSGRCLIVGLLATAVLEFGYGQLCILPMATPGPAMQLPYDCRSEEPGGGTIVTYPRQVPGLARRHESKRARQRAARQARRETAAAERAAEVRRLKNLKVQAVRDECATPGRAFPLPSACIWCASAPR